MGNDQFLDLGGSYKSYTHTHEHKVCIYKSLYIHRYTDRDTYMSTHIHIPIYT